MLTQELQMTLVCCHYILCIILLQLINFYLLTNVTLAGSCPRSLHHLWSLSSCHKGCTNGLHFADIPISTAFTHNDFVWWLKFFSFSYSKTCIYKAIITKRSVEAHIILLLTHSTRVACILHWPIQMSVFSVALLFWVACLYNCLISVWCGIGVIECSPRMSPMRAFILTAGVMAWRRWVLCVTVKISSQYCGSWYWWRNNDEIM